MTDSVEDQYEILSTVDCVVEEREKAIQLRVPKWNNAVVWFVRFKLRIDDDIIWCENNHFQEKKNAQSI